MPDAPPSPFPPLADDATLHEQAQTLAEQNPEAAAAARLLAEAGWRLTPDRLAHTLDPDNYIRYPHARLISKMFVKAATTDNFRGIINVPPQYGKSETTSRWGPAWYLDMWPHRNIALTSYGADLAWDNSRVVRDRILEYPDRFRVRLAEDSRAKNKWHTGKGGGLLATGVGGPFTGFGAHLVVIDDPIKDWKEAHSSQIRENVWNWYKSVVLTRLRKGGSILIVMTRWHHEDLCGKVLGENPGQWEVLRLPALADSANDPLGRAEGEALCEELHPKAEVEQAHLDLGTYLFTGMYQGRPSPQGGGIIKKKWWNFYEGLPVPDLTGWVGSWDMAFKKTEDSSFVVCQIWCQVGANRYLIHQERGRMGFVETKALFRRMKARFPQVGTWLVEDKANGSAIIDELSSEIGGIIPVTPDGSKEARVHAVTPQIEAGNCFLPINADWVDDFLEECAAFPKGTNDDQVDAMSQALDRMAPRRINLDDYYKDNTLSDSR